MPRSDGSYQSTINREPRSEKGVAITLDPGVRRRQMLGPVVRVSADNGDPAAPQGDQVLDRRAGRADVVHRDVVDRPTEDPFPEHDERKAQILEESAVVGTEPLDRKSTRLNS